MNIISYRIMIFQIPYYQSKKRLTMSARMDEQAGVGKYSVTQVGLPSHLFLSVLLTLIFNHDLDTFLLSYSTKHISQRFFHTFSHVLDQSSSKSFNLLSSLHPHRHPAVLSYPLESSLSFSSLCFLFVEVPNPSSGWEPGSHGWCARDTNRTESIFSRITFLISPFLRSILDITPKRKHPSAFLSTPFLSMQPSNPGPDQQIATSIRSILQHVHACVHHPIPNPRAAVSRMEWKSQPQYWMAEFIPIQLEQHRTALHA